MSSGNQGIQEWQCAFLLFLHVEVDAWVEAVQVLVKSLQLLLPMWLDNEGIINVLAPQLGLEWG